MDFPDKIYAYFSFPNFSSHLRSRMWFIEPVGPGKNIEYIRKDALLEWAEKEIEKDEYILTLDMLIDKLNSM